MNLSSWRQSVLFPLSFIQASSMMVKDLLRPEHESWSQGSESEGGVQASGSQCSYSHRLSVQWWPKPPKPCVPGLGTSASALLLLSALPWHSPASVLLILLSRPLQHLLSHLLSLTALITHCSAAEWIRIFIIQPCSQLLTQCLLSGQGT